MNFIKKKFFDLYHLLHYHDYLYHVLNMPIISDSEYDFLVNKLRVLKKKHMQVACKIEKNFFKSNKFDFCKENYHFTPMLSLDNTFDINGYIKFHNNIKNYFHNADINFFCELKFDGVALNLLYRKGELVRAFTRGNGLYGEDVTENAYVVNNIPLKLKGLKVPELIEVRGEVCMLKEDFQKFNISAVKNNNKIFSNTRNAAAGSLRQKNTMITKQRKLFFYCYGCNIISKFPKYRTHSEQLNMLLHLGFSISQYILLSNNINKILSFYYLIERVRNFLSLNIDGIVVKVDSIKLQKSLGMTSKFPKWAIALKFVSKSAKTKILGVDYQIGRTGIITPVAHLESILISGVIVQKASLYNKSEMDKLDLHIGDTVIVCRSGDVIPKIKSVVTYLRLPFAKKIFFPKYCPSCHSLLCTNNIMVQCLAGINCLEQRKKSIQHFFSKNGLYAENFSTGVIKQLVYQKYIKTPVDCFKLTTSILLKLKYFGIKSATKIIDALQKCKITTLVKFIYALGIPEIGLENSILIANYFGSFDKVIHCTINQLKRIKHIGIVCANYFFDFINSKKNILYIMRLIEEGGIIFQDNKNQIIYNKNSIFLNRKISFTGKFQYFNRTEIIQKMILLGGIITKNISSKTDFLIVGKKPGGKLTQAKKLNIKIILEYVMKDILEKYDSV